MFRILIVVGARPNFMKASPLVRELQKVRSLIRFKIVHTGQHYDYDMSKTFFRELEIPRPDYSLNVGSGSHAVQTGKIMTRFEDVCDVEKPDLVIVVGDVNSTLACSIVAKKQGAKVAHMEAGLRSFDMRMPEEINRIVTDSITDYFFITERSGRDHLIQEGKSKDALFLVGNLMIDNLYFQLAKLRESSADTFEFNTLKKKLRHYACLTLHRPSNVDNKHSLCPLIKEIGRVAEKIPVIFPVHPRTKMNLRKFGIALSPRIFLTRPLPYREFLNLWKDSKFVLTDSGGIQEETTALRIPCFTLRENTERPITVEEGTNVLIGRNYRLLHAEVNKILRGQKPKGRIPKFWDGKAGKRIVKILAGMAR